MALIEWSDKDFNVASPKMNEQHKTWVGIINRLNEALFSSESDDYKYTLFKELTSYTDVHFSEEEKFMESIGYPYIQGHKEMHYVFKLTILEEVQKLFRGEPVMMPLVMDQLKDWLTDHILREDMKYGKYILQQQQP